MHINSPCFEKAIAEPEYLIYISQQNFITRFAYWTFISLHGYKLRNKQNHNVNNAFSYLDMDYVDVRLRVISVNYC